MTAVLRILGGLWVGVAGAVIAVAYGLLLIWDGTGAASATLAGPGPLGLLGMAAILMPGLVLLFTASWIDRQGGRR